MVHRYGTVCPETCNQYSQAGKELLIAEAEDHFLYEWNPEFFFAIGNFEESYCFSSFIDRTVDRVCGWGTRVCKDEMRSGETNSDEAGRYVDTDDLRRRPCT